MMGMLWLKSRTKADCFGLSKGGLSWERRQETAVGEEKNAVFWDGVDGLYGLYCLGETDAGFEALFSSFGSSG